MHLKSASFWIVFNILLGKPDYVYPIITRVVGKLVRYEDLNFIFQYRFSPYRPAKNMTFFILESNGRRSLHSISPLTLLAIVQ